VFSLIERFDAEWRSDLRPLSEGMPMAGSMWPPLFGKRRSARKPVKRSGGRAPARSPHLDALEQLESRTLLSASTITVTTTSDAVTHTGTSLRDAISQAEANATASSPQTIVFADGLAGGTITLQQGQFLINNTAGLVAIDESSLSSPVTINASLSSRIFQVNNGAQLVLQDASLENGENTDNPGGGAITNSGSLTLDGSTFSNNVASNYGGGAVSNFGILAVNNCSFSANSGPTGGAIYSVGSAANVTVNDSVFTGNFGGLGGGAIYNSGLLTVTASTFANNSVYTGASTSGAGGAIGNAAGRASISACTFDTNSAGSGGAIDVEGWITVTGSAMVDNSATDGGAISAEVYPLVMVNSTLSGNMATANGGAIYSASQSAVALTDCTVSGNSAGAEGGGVFSSGSQAVALVNTIVGDNSATTAGPDVEGAVTGNNSLVRDGTSLTGMSNGSAGNQVGTSAQPVEPMLGTLRNNGGPTETMALLPGSPAIQAGGVVTTVAQSAGTSNQTIYVANAGLIASAPGAYLVSIDGEEIEVTNADDTTGALTVVRDLNGAPAALNPGDTVYLYTDQRGVVRGQPSDVGAFAYTTTTAPPTVSAVSPASGSAYGGTTVTITGTNLAAATAVDFGSAPATISGRSATQLTVIAPAGPAGTVDVTVTTAGGTSAKSAQDQFTYLPVPTVSGVTPSVGALAGGITVTITGTNLSGATVVDFGAAPATITNDSATQITVTAPAGSAGTVDVTVTTATGTSAKSALDQFTYVAAPTVSGVSPLFGPVAGGSPVTITGTNLSGATAVDFGTAAGTITTDSGTQITVTTPAVTFTGTVFVTVTTAGGTSAPSAHAQFTFVPAPTVGEVSPDAGPLAGGISVTIYGTNLDGPALVYFGATPATIVTDSGTQITAIAPAGSAGTVDVTVATIGGTSAKSIGDQFTYVAAPTVSSISPNAGPLGGGISVTITGTNLWAATAVDFGAVAATITYDSNTQIQATAPAALAGTVDVTVTTAGSTSATSVLDRFTYVAAPTVSGVSPNAGPLAGGVSVTITGTNLSGATAVHFGTTAAMITNDSATAITATAPAGSAGTVDVTVTTAGGTSAKSALDQFTYTAAPTVSGVSPNAGPLAGGISVTITGANFLGATTVDFGTAAAIITSDTATQIIATNPAGSAGPVDVIVTTAAGTSATSAADRFTYVAPPAVTGVSPSSGPTGGGTSVSITGTNLGGATAVLFGTAAGTITSDTATQVIVTSPAGTAGAAVDVTVTTAGGTSATSSADRFTYVATPAITAVNPSAGPTAGGTSVTITGTTLLNATAVRFGSFAAQITSDSATQIIATSPAENAAAVDVTVTTAGGTSATSSADHFTYVAAPTVTSVSPALGPTAGGSSVTITGSNLAGAIAVRFGQAAAIITSDTATQIIATSPAGSAGAVDVTVSTAGGTSATSSIDRFTYVAAPAITALSPGAGPSAGGTSVTITGTNLLGATAVHFGSFAAQITSDSATQIVATSPAENAATVDITVTTAAGTSTTSSADRFSYVAPPVITGVSPVSGSTAGGMAVTITGVNLDQASAVHFGTALATINSDSTTQIVVADPAGAAGTIDVTVTNAGGTSATSLADRFTYVTPPVVTGISPSTGPVAGGSSVTITGNNLAAATTVSFGAALATITSDSATQLVVTSPAGSPATVDVTVTTAGGTSPTSAADQFTYAALPTVTAVTPGAGPTGGGTMVTIQGTSLAGATAVRFGTLPATIRSDSPTQITVTSPAGFAGAVDITVTTAGGTSAVSSAVRFTYAAAPAVTGVTPFSGPANGGTTVTITGTNLAGAVAVDFGSAAATITSDSSTQMIVTSPSGSAGPVDVTVTTAGGTSAKSSADVFTYLSQGPTWQAVDLAVGSDEQARILWRSSAGSEVVWQVTNSFGVATGATYGPLPGWTPIADAVGGDALTRVLWTNTNGAVALWLLNQSGTLVNAAVFGPISGWSVRDLTVGPDNATRILWDNSSGQSVIWRVDDSFQVTSGPVFGPYAGWTASKLAAGSDGLLRLLWTNASGAISLWLLNSDASYVSSAVFGPISGWTATSLTVGSDSQVRLLWDNVNGAAAVWQVSNSFAITATWLYGPFTGWQATALSAGGDGVIRLLWDATDTACLWLLSDSGYFLEADVLGPI
jgi:hypothetical protein